MARYLMAYHSREGQTLKIMQRLRDSLVEQKHEVELLNIAQLTEGYSLSRFDAAVLGASIRYGHFNKQFYSFIEHHKHALDSLPSAFFGVNLTARKPEKNRPETNAYMKKFAQRSPWHPTLQGVFAGACLYSRYRWYDKAIIRLIMKITNGPTDPSVDVEFTDWHAVDKFAEKLAGLTGGK